MPQKTTAKTRLVDLGKDVYEEVAKIANESEMAVSAVARLLLKHALSIKGKIGYIPHSTNPQRKYDIFDQGNQQSIAHIGQSVDQGTASIGSSNLGFHPADLR